LAPPQDEVLNPHGEERGNAAHLEPCGRWISSDHDSPQPENALAEGFDALPSLRGAERRSDPSLFYGNMDCFASLAMTIQKTPALGLLTS